MPKEGEFMALAFNEIAEIEVAIDNAIDKAMNGYVGEQAVSNVQEIINAVVYQAYTPVFFDRTGALMAKENLPYYYDSEAKEFHITTMAEWNNIGYRRTTGQGIHGELGTVIAENGMYGAGPRDFVGESEKVLPNAMDKPLEASLRSAGL